MNWYPALSVAAIIAFTGLVWWAGKGLERLAARIDRHRLRRQTLREAAIRAEARAQADDWMAVVNAVREGRHRAACQCCAWDPYGDRPVAIFCRDHCPDCDEFSPCAAHDPALWAEMERRATQ